MSRGNDLVWSAEKAHWAGLFLAFVGVTMIFSGGPRAVDFLGAALIVIGIVLVVATSPCLWVRGVIDWFS